jgi:hypothetical protein
MPVFYLRNDDVNLLDDELPAVSRRCTAAGVPITHAVEPANVTEEAAAWLLDERAPAPRLVEIMQHGFDHRKRDRGEFGGRRPFAEQRRDLALGKRIMQDRFGAAFLPCLNFPFGPYNQASMRAADELGYRIVCSHYNCRPSRRFLYAVGRLLGRGQILDRHVSHHLDYYAGTGLFSIDMAVSFIERYIGEYGSRECVFHSADWIVDRVHRFLPHTPVVGLLLHHRFHTSEESLDLITEVLARLQRLPGAEFLNLHEIYRRYCPDPGEGFRDDR